MSYINLRIYNMDNTSTVEEIREALQDYGFDAVFGNKYDFEISVESEGEHQSIRTN